MEQSVAKMKTAAGFTSLVILAAYAPYLVRAAAAAAATATEDAESSIIEDHKSCICPLNYQPVCGSDGVTYSNECMLRCANKDLGSDSLTVLYPGECVSCACTADYNPVCASNGITYSNLCWMLCENEKRRRLGLPDLTVLWRGTCGCNCTREWDPVCVSNYRTWLNPCLLECENRRRYLNGLPLLKVLYEGVCRSCYCGYCSTRYSPVCGSDHLTYWNICFLRCRNDCNVASGLPPVRQVPDNECY